MVGNAHEDSSPRHIYGDKNLFLRSLSFSVYAASYAAVRSE